MSPRFLGAGVVTAVLVLLADQGSKWWMDAVLRLQEVRHVPLLAAGPFTLDFSMVWNRGVTFGLLAGDAPWHGWLLAAAALAVAALLVRWLLRAETRAVAVALGAIIGGAVGNVIDRLRWGAVFDFVDASAWGWHWYVFNVADAAIVLGVLALVADALFRTAPVQPAAATPAAATPAVLPPAQAPAAQAAPAHPAASSPAAPRPTAAPTAAPSSALGPATLDRGPLDPDRPRV